MSTLPTPNSFDAIMLNAQVAYGRADFEDSLRLYQRGYETAVATRQNTWSLDGLLEAWQLRTKGLMIVDKQLNGERKPIKIILN